MVEPWESLALEAGGEDFAQQRIVPYIEGHELSVVHDVIKWVAGSVAREKFWHEEPSWGFAIDNARTKRRGEHVI